MVICKVAYSYGQEERKRSNLKIYFKAGLLKKYFFSLFDNNNLVPDKKNPFFANFVCAAKKFSSGIQSASMNIKYS